MTLLGELCFANHPSTSMCTFANVLFIESNGIWMGTCSVIPGWAVTGPSIEGLIIAVPSSINAFLKKMHQYEAHASWVDPEPFRRDL